MTEHGPALCARTLSTARRNVAPLLNTGIPAVTFIVDSNIIYTKRAHDSRSEIHDRHALQLTLLGILGQTKGSTKPAALLSWLYFKPISHFIS